MKILSFIFIVFLFVVGCRKQSEQNLETGIYDDLGNKFKSDFRPLRIVSLAPNLTEIIYFLNSDSLLLGVTDYCNFPEQAKTKQKIGSMLSPNMEIIHYLKPDLIIMTTEGNTRITYNYLKDLSYNIYVSNPRSISGILKTIMDLAIITGKSNEIRKWVDDKKHFLDSLTTKNSLSEKVSVLVLLSLKPLITFNNNTFINEIFHINGYYNVFEKEPVSYPVISDEDIIKKKPEIIFYLGDTTGIVNESFLTQANKLPVLVNYIRNNHVIILEQDIYSRPGPRIFDAIENLDIKKRSLSNDSVVK